MLNNFLNMLIFGIKSKEEEFFNQGYSDVMVTRKVHYFHIWYAFRIAIYRPFYLISLSELSKFKNEAALRFQLRLKGALTSEDLSGLSEREIQLLSHEEEVIEHEFFYRNKISMFEAHKLLGYSTINIFSFLELLLNQSVIFIVLLVLLANLIPR
jgi:hypothetical protein